MISYVVVDILVLSHSNSYTHEHEFLPRNDTAKAQGTSVSSTLWHPQVAFQNYVPLFSAAGRYGNPCFPCRPWPRAVMGAFENVFRSRGEMQSSSPPLLFPGPAGGRGSALPGHFPPLQTACSYYLAISCWNVCFFFFFFLIRYT